MWHPSCRCCKYTTSVDIQKRTVKKLVTHVESHASTVSLLESREYRYINNNNKQEVHVTVALTELQVFTPLSVTDPVSRSQQHQAVVAVKNKNFISVNFDDLPGLLQTTLKCPVLHCSSCKHPSWTPGNWAAAVLNLHMRSQEMRVLQPRRKDLIHFQFQNAHTFYTR